MNEKEPRESDPAASMELLKRCVEYCMENKHDSLRIWQTTSFDWCVSNDMAYADAPTLELAIALFAKKLFSTNEDKSKKGME